LQQQALAPLLDPLEMDGGSVAHVAATLRRSPYAPLMTQLFGAGVFDDPARAVGEALFAVGRYQFEDSSFHPYSSKYDHWLEGTATLTPSELRGYRLFNDPKRANCAGCHLDAPSPDGLPPLFTDHQYEALGAPRNAQLASNRDPAFFDLGICGPVRTDMRAQRMYCGMFATPTLRNVATRRTFFHNGVYHSLQAVLDFYDFRDTRPERIYPRTSASIYRGTSAGTGAVATYDDLPAAYRRNIDTIDPPFDRRRGEPPVLTTAEEHDIIAFLRTLTDGNR
jgi:cytochrome c peroxidase